MDDRLYNNLSEEEKNIIVKKGTELPFSGKYYDFFGQGGYHCKRCNELLYRSDDKFATTCGWPSFDNEIKGGIKRQIDSDGVRTEILCASCGAHLGHVFKGEGLTDSNIRHCVNSISLVFVPGIQLAKNSKAYFAGGCFWGVEYLFKQKEGVISAVSGYMGGFLDNPSYQDVCQGDTGHLEVVEVLYNPGKVKYEELVKFFFEIHNPTQVYGQGPDIGEQYLSTIFYKNENEQKIINKLIAILKEKGFNVVTKLYLITTFWKAEEYHQNYYDRKKQQPYCHIFKKKF